MSARIRDRSLLATLTLTLASGAVGGENQAVANIRGTYTAGPASGATNEFVLGAATENYDQTAGDTTVQVRLYRPVELEWFANDGNIAIATDFLAKVYLVDGDTVSKTKVSNGLNRAYAGQVWAVDAVRGVGVRVTQVETADLLS